MRRAGLRSAILFLCVSCAAAPRAGDSARRSPAKKTFVDASGRRYRLEPIPKSQATKLDDKHIQTMIGATAELEAEDAANYYVRYYEAAEEAASAPAPPPPPSSPPAAPAESPALPSGPALRLVDFGEGLPKSGQWREGFGVGDVNRDGHPDLVFPPARKSPGYPVVFLGDGAGHWTRWREARFPPFPYDYGDAQVADLDGDGIADIALAMHHRGIVALLGDGKGNFRLASDGLDFAARQDTIPDFSSRCLRAFDVDGDGRIDLVALGEGPIIPFGGPGKAHGSSGVVVYENRSGGRWEARRQAPRAGLPFGSAMAVGDFDGDGRLDLAIASGVLGSREILEFGSPEGWRLGEVASLPAEGYLRAIAAADFDGDGVDDLVVGGSFLEGEDWVGRVDVYLSREHGTVWERRPLLRGAEVMALAAGPIAGKGSPAAVAALTDVGKLLIFRSDGRGHFETLPVSEPETGCAGSAIQLVDLDGDGHPEIVAAYADEATSTRSGCPSQGMVKAFKIDFASGRP